MPRDLSVLEIDYLRNVPLRLERIAKCLERAEEKDTIFIVKSESEIFYSKEDLIDHLKKVSPDKDPKRLAHNLIEEGSLLKARILK